MALQPEQANKKAQKKTFFALMCWPIYREEQKMSSSDAPEAPPSASSHTVGSSDDRQV
jgi:hypothetical protein